MPSAPARVTWPTALSWRLRRQLLGSVGDAGEAIATSDATATATGVAAVAGRLGAVAAQLDPSFAELGLRTRLAYSQAGDVERALAAGELVKTFAFRGALHLMTPEQAGVHLALRASSKMWERRGWQEFYLLGPSDWPELRAAVRDALAAGPLTRAELGRAVADHARFAHLAHAFTHQSGTFLKPLAWLGDLSVGPPREDRLTLQRLDTNPRWSGLPDPDDAGPRALRTYLGAYAPASEANLRYWLSDGLGVRRTSITRWLDELGEQVASVDVEGETRLVLSEDLHALVGEAHAARSTAVRLLPRYDQWVLGPGTGDTRVVPAALRAAVSRGSDLVVVDGVVAGTWSIRRGEVHVTWGSEAGADVAPALRAEVDRLGQILGKPLALADAPR